MRQTWFVVGALTSVSVSPAVTSAIANDPPVAAVGSSPSATALPVKPRKPDVGFYATTQDVVEKMLDLVKTTEKDVVYDLGCGDGRFVTTAAAKYGCKAVGVELDPKYVEIGKKIVADRGLSEKVEIRQGDIFETDLRPATVVTLFLLPEMNQKLIPQLEKLPAHARIIAHEFDIPGLIPEESLTFISKEDDSEHLLYIYKMPLKKQPTP